MSEIITKSHDEIVEARARVAEELGPHWSLTTSGAYKDDPACWRLERAAGGKQEVIHRDIDTVLQLARDVDARLPLAEATVAIAEGLTTTVNYR